MIKTIKYTCFLVLALGPCPHHARAQEAAVATDSVITETEDTSSYGEESTYEENTRYSKSGQQMYLNDTLQKKEFNREDWKKITKDLDYTEASDKPKPEKKKADIPEAPKGPGTDWSGVAGPLLIIIAVAVLAFVLYKLFSGRVSNTRVERKETYSIEEVEEALHESDLERFLREAIEGRKFRLALRIYYLMAIKELSARNWINWKKNKTNNQYIFEMRARPNFELFRDITRLYEYAWYGEMTVEETHFNLLGEKFREFLRQLKTLPD